MGNLKVLIATQEMAPYTELTQQSELLRDLAIAYQKRGAEVRVFMPKYGLIKERKHRLHEVIRLSGLNITIGRNNNPLIIKVASLQTAKIQVYFLDNEDFFKRKHFFSDDDNQYFSDNDERIIFFNKSVIELLMKLGWKPDIIHCQGWMSGLVPMYSRTLFKNEPTVKTSKIVFSVFDDGFNHTLNKDFEKKSHLKFTDDLLSLAHPQTFGFNKSGSKYADVCMLSSENIDTETEKYIQSLEKPIIDIRNEGTNYYDTYFKTLGI